MNQNELYPEDVAWFVRAFSRGASCCSVECEACGRVHFVSARGHGDYSPGELESLIQRSIENPDRYVNWSVFDSIDTCDLEGKHVVLGCQCDPSNRVREWLLANISEVSQFCIEYQESRRAMLERELVIAQDRSRKLTRYRTQIEVKEITGTHAVLWVAGRPGMDRVAYPLQSFPDRLGSIYPGRILHAMVNLGDRLSDLTFEGWENN